MLEVLNDRLSKLFYAAEFLLRFVLEALDRLYREADHFANENGHRYRVGERKSDYGRGNVCERSWTVLRGMIRGKVTHCLYNNDGYNEHTEKPQKYAGDRPPQRAEEMKENLRRRHRFTLLPAITSRHPVGSGFYRGQCSMESDIRLAR